MNQIPNIEETHDTREVEEAVEFLFSGENEFGKYKHQGIGNCTKENVTKVLHHQLQKAREELAVEVRLLVAKYYKTDEFDVVGFLNELQAELDQDKVISRWDKS